MKRRQCEHDSFMFFVRSLEGKTITLEGNLDEYVSCVLSKLVSRRYMSDAAAKSLRLVYKGKNLNLEKTFRECGIERESTVHIVGRLPSISHDSVALEWVSHLHALCTSRCACDAYHHAQLLLNQLNKMPKLRDKLCVELDDVNFVPTLRAAVEHLSNFDIPEGEQLGISQESMLRVARMLPQTSSLLCATTIAAVVQPLDWQAGETRRKQEQQLSEECSLTRQVLLSLSLAIEFCHQPVMCEELSIHAEAAVNRVQGHRAYLLTSTAVAHFAQRQLIKIMQGPLGVALEVFEAGLGYSLETGEQLEQCGQGVAQLFASLCSMFADCPVANDSALAPQCREMLQMALDLATQLTHTLQEFLSHVASRPTASSQYLSNCSYILWLVKGLYHLSGSCAEADPVTLVQLRLALAELLPLRPLHRCMLAKHLHPQGVLHPLLKDEQLRDALPLYLRTDAMRLYRNQVNTTEMLLYPYALHPVRHNLLESSFEQLMGFPDEALNTFLRVHFLCEEGEGVGVVREWLSSVGQAVFDPQLGLFLRCPTNPKAVHPSHLAAVQPRHLEYFQFAGRIVGLALLFDIPLDIHVSAACFHFLRLSSSLFNAQQVRVTMQHMEEVDPDKATSYRNLLQGEDVQRLGLTFTTSYDRLGLMIERPLVEGGEQRQVTDANKREFVAAMVYEELIGRVKDELVAFRRGVHSVFSGQDVLYLFTSKSFNTLLGGVDQIAVEDWHNATNVKGWNDLHVGQGAHIMEWFWEVVSGMSQQQRRRLLMFWTALKSLPAGGFTSLPAKPEIVREEYQKHRVPRAQTCFCQLFLPDYPSKEELADALQTAIQNFEGFGMA